jgi:hypothetical protein
VPTTAILFLVLAGLSILALLVQHSAFAFLLYQLVYFMSPATRWWGAFLPDLPWSFMTVVLMAGALALRWRTLAPRTLWREQPLVKWVLGLLIMMGLINFVALLPDHHWRFTGYFFNLVVIMAIAYRLLDSERMLKLSIATYVFGATYVGYEAWTIGRNFGDRLEGVGMVDSLDANDTAAALAPVLFLAAYFAWLGTWPIRALCLVAGAFVANALVLINSRGAILGVACGGLYMLAFMLFSRHQRPGQRLMAIALVLVAVAGGLYLTDQSFWDRMVTLANLDDERESGSHRIHFWLATFDMLEDHPLGLGAGGYAAISEHYLDEDIGTDRIVNKTVHSSWFQALFELGWPGLFLFGGMVFCALRLLHRTQNSLSRAQDADAYFFVTAIGAAFICYVVAASFIDRYRAEVMYWLVLFVGVAANVFMFQRALDSREDMDTSFATLPDDHGKKSNESVAEGSQPDLPYRHVRGRAVAARSVQTPVARRPLR